MRTFRRMRSLQLMDVTVWSRESLTTLRLSTFCVSFTRISNSLKGKQTFLNVFRWSRVYPVFKSAFFGLVHRCADENPYVPTYQVSKEKTKSLGIEYIPLEVSIKETVESLKEKGFIHF